MTGENLWGGWAEIPAPQGFSFVRFLVGRGFLLVGFRLGIGA